MPQIQVIEHIDAPPLTVWELISDIRRGPEYVTVMLDVVHADEGELREGFVYRETSKIGPSVSETEWRVTRVDAPRVQVHECAEPTLQARLTMRVEPEGDGTRLVHHTDYRLMPVFRPLGWLLEKLFAHRLMTTEMRQTVQNCKQLVEQEHAALAQSLASETS